jgi:hypothetical protein
MSRRPLMVLIGSPPPRPAGRLPPWISAADQPDQQPPPHHRGADSSRNHPGDQEPAHHSPSPRRRELGDGRSSPLQQLRCAANPSPGRREVERRSVRSLRPLPGVTGPSPADGAPWSMIIVPTAKPVSRSGPLGSPRALPKRHAISPEQIPHTASVFSAVPRSLDRPRETGVWPPDPRRWTVGRGLLPTDVSGGLRTSCGLVADC